jgi:hypothetical protein
VTIVRLWKKKKMQHKPKLALCRVFCARCMRMAKVEDTRDWRYYDITGALCPECAKQYKTLVDNFMGRNKEEKHDN